MNIYIYKDILSVLNSQSKLCLWGKHYASSNAMQEIVAVQS